MAWHLNLKHGAYSVEVSIAKDKETKDFGIKEINGDLRNLGKIHLNYEELLKNKIITKPGNFRVRIYYENPEFYLSTTRDNQNREYLKIKYPENKE